MANVPYLGSIISLISKSEIRYEGVLYAIDTKESTVALAKVRLFGTEDRITNRPVAPRDEIHDYIIFRANDIKDLHVSEAPKSQHGLPPDPAIVQHSSAIPSYEGRPFGTLYGLGPFQQLATQPNFPLMTSSHYSGSSRSATPTPRKSPTSDAGVQVSVGNKEASPERIRKDPRDQFQLRSRNAVPQNYQNRWRQPLSNRQQQPRRRSIPRRGRGRTVMQHTIQVFDNEYDFEQANAKFLELESELSKSTLDDSAAEQSPESDVSGNTYDKKKSFFDDISSEASQRSKGLPRFDWRMERKLNVETFGVSASNAWLRRRRGRGGFRRSSFRGRPRQGSEKTVTFNDPPVVQEVEVATVEKVQDPLPVIEVVAVDDSAKTEWPEPETKQEQSVWN